MMQHPGTYDHKCGVYFFLKLLYQYRCIRYCQETPIQSMQVSVYQILIDSLTPQIMIDKFLYSQNNLVSDSVTIQFLFVFGPCSPCSCSEFCSYDSSCSSYGHCSPCSCSCSYSEFCSYDSSFSSYGLDFLFQFLQRFFFYFYFQLLLCIILILVIFLFLVLIPYLVLVLVLILVFIRILVLILIIVLVLF